MVRRGELLPIDSDFGNYGSEQGSGQNRGSDLANRPPPRRAHSAFHFCFQESGRKEQNHLREFATTTSETLSGAAFRAKLRPRVLSTPLPDSLSSRCCLF